MTTGSEKRRHPRVDIPLLVQFRTSQLEEFRTEYATNISEGGIYISGVSALPEGTEVSVQFVTRDRLHLVSVQAKVVRSRNGAGQGIQFLTLEPADQKAVQDLINRELAKANPPPVPDVTQD